MPSAPGVTGESRRMRLIENVCDSLLLVATAAGMLLTGLVVLSAAMRYVVGSPFAFTEEIVGLLFAAMVFLSFPSCTIHRRHIEVTLISERLPPGARRVARTAGNVLILLFCAWYGTYAWEFASVSWRLHSKSDVGGIVLWPWMGTMVLSCFLIAVAIVTLWRARRLDQGAGTSGA
ncbi:MAG: TRAP transporter small permease [Casimicrobiaceae bacterium]